MSIRINGFPEAGVLGYFCGKNALVSLAVSTIGDVRIQDTGAVCSYAELLRVLGTTDTAIVLDYIIKQGIVSVGSAWSESTLEAQYTASYAAQVNLRRIIDILQQRAVVISSSDVAHGVNVVGFKNIQSDAIADVTLASAEVITVLIERADVFDLDVKTFQGVPTAEIEEGRNLLNDLVGVPMLSEAGVEVKLTSAAVDAAGNFGIKVMKLIPAIF